MGARNGEAYVAGLRAARTHVQIHGETLAGGVADHPAFRTAARNWYPKAYQRFPEILHTLGASGLMAIPTQADVEGAARGDIVRYHQSATLDGPERIRLFRLAWDLSMSSFAGRQSLYEYFFFGDPVRMAGALVQSYDREPYRERVRAFLARDDA